MVSVAVPILWCSLISGISGCWAVMAEPSRAGHIKNMWCRWDLWGSLHGTVHRGAAMSIRVCVLFIWKCVQPSLWIPHLLTLSHQLYVFTEAERWLKGSWGTDSNDNKILRLRALLKETCAETNLEAATANLLQKMLLIWLSCSSNGFSSVQVVKQMFKHGIFFQEAAHHKPWYMPCEALQCVVLYNALRCQS